MAKSSTKTLKPIMKWAGGKAQMLKDIIPKIPEYKGKYIEPFFGGGALFFALRPDNAVIADSNPELINMYVQVATNVDAVIEKLKTYENTEEMFYEIRALDWETLPQSEAAARTIYLNKTCFNGLYRVNQKGQFNTPFGKYKNPTICDEDLLRSVSELLKKANIICGDYLDVLMEYAAPGDFVFLDPPYVPVSEYADFKRYRLSIKLSENFGKAKSIKTLVITRTYNLYNPTTGKLIPKKKVMKKVSLEQGYETVYLGNPSRLQDNILGKLDSDNPTPEFLTPGMISGSFFNPLLVPKNHSVPASDSEDGKRKVMNYTFQIYYEKCEPNEKGSFSTVKLTGKDLKDYVDEFSVSSEWRIYDDSGKEEKSWTVDGIFENYGTQLIKSTSEDEKNYIAPCLYNEYVTREDFMDVNVRTYVVMTVNFRNKAYQYYDLVYPKVES